jgi:hypothetical protein
MSESTERGADGKVQGEGDYEAAKRYRDKVTEFVKHSDVEDLARKANPLSPREARDDALAEENARGRSKGDDPADVGIMYPHQGSHKDADADAQARTTPEGKK